MADQNFPDNVLYNMDNLDVLRGMNSETVDLIATDPPFNKKRNRAASAGAYEDAWRWEDDPSMVNRPDQWLWQPVHRIWLDQIKDENPALFSVIEATRLTQDDDTAAFLCFLGVRLLAMHRVLKPTGSIYLHCDHSANGYIRMVMDAVFGKRNFRNEVVWKSTTAHSDSARYGANTESIFFYTKGNKWTWNQMHVPYDEKYKARFKHKELNGRAFQDDNLTAKGLTGGGYEYEYKGKKELWRVPPETMKKLDAEDRLYFTREGGIRIKRYLDEMTGRPVQQLWDDIDPLNSQAKERTGSPDQKPLALYERIIQASSNPGDLVLDPFAGCATTPIAAHNLGRRWVGIDRREDAAFHITNRLLGLGINVDEFKTRQQFLLPELQGSCEIRYEAPARTDDGETAAPGLAPVYAPSERSTLTHREMKEYLIETFGTQCWGCDFDVKDGRYLQLDHVDPKADGGSNHLDNRALLCQPCNGTKGNRLTISELRRQNIRDNHLAKPAGAKRGDDGHPIKLREARAQCREALERHRMGLPLQLGMML